MKGNDIVIEFMDPEDLRKPAVPGHQDLRAWRFRDKWWNDDTSTVLCWTGLRGAVFHEQHCTTTPKEEPTAKLRMDRVRAVFETEHPLGTFRWFGFCGNCLTQRIANFGWQPSERDKAQLDTLKTVLNDIRILGEQPISRKELTVRMKRYNSGAPSPRELNRLLDYYRQNRGDEESDLTLFLL
ncbi:hypothetical protein [Microbacterium sp. CH12i]|uniref:hypothetical protein n=1 Tax=Microbacterium sp. CH12i TaxID=1479651 RepID=UPI001267C2EE|nr:hypothetical protein [Microbacterium sp. CH12i]